MGSVGGPPCPICMSIAGSIAGGKGPGTAPIASITGVAGGPRTFSFRDDISSFLVTPFALGTRHHQPGPSPTKSRPLTLVVNAPPLPLPRALHPPRPRSSLPGLFLTSSESSVEISCPCPQRRTRILSDPNPKISKRAPREIDPANGLGAR